MPAIKQVWGLIQQGDYANPSDLKDAYLHIPIIKHHLLFMFGKRNITSKGFHLRWLHPLRFSLHLLNSNNFMLLYI